MAGRNITYLLNDKNQFIINYEAISDEDTIVNLTNHNLTSAIYFSKFL